MLHLFLDNNNGAIFVMALIMVGVLAILSVTFASIVTFEMRNNAAWQMHSTQALYVAEAGIARSWNVLKGSINGPDSLNNILLGADGVANTDDDGVLSFGSSVDFGEGSYSVVVIDNNDGDGNNFIDSDDTAIIVSTGTIIVDAAKNRKIERTINVMFTSAFVPNHSILTGGDLLIGDEDPGTMDEVKIQPVIVGNYVNIHTNGGLKIGTDSELTVYGNITAGGDVIISEGGKATAVGGIISGQASHINIPSIDPEFYRVRADYELSGDWNFSGGTEATYYIEGNAIVSGVFNQKVTIIAAGNIEISGEPQMQAETPGLLLVAGGDITIIGEPRFYNGAILAHKSITMSSTGVICEAKLEEVVIIVENADGSSNELTGELTITCEGDPTNVYTGNLNRLSWY